MKKWCLGLCVCAWATLGSAAVTYNDSTGDIDPGIGDGSGTLDIVSVEVSHTASGVIFDLTVDGNLSTSDWGKFMIGIATGDEGTTNGNGWDRPIYLDSPIGGMNVWIGSWVDGGGGAQLYTYDGVAWQGPSSLTAFSFTPGAQSLVSFTAAEADLGLSIGDTFYFDVYSSGGMSTDSAVDALSNPNISVTAWDQSYTSRTNDTGISSYILADYATADLTPSNGPFAGGNEVVVTNGDFGTITNVLVGGVEATILDSGASWVTVAMPAAGAAGTVDVVVQTSDNGETVLANAYTYNPAGAIGGTTYGPCAWTNLGSGVNGTPGTEIVQSLVWDGTHLYAGGNFTNMGGVSATNVAMWDSAGGSWTNLGSGVNNVLFAMAHDGTNLYAGGNFTQAGGVSARYVAMWNGTTWTNLGAGANQRVWNLACDGTNLYCANDKRVTPNNAAAVGTWNGTTWSNAVAGPSTLPRLLYDVEYVGGKLYACGGFRTLGGVVVTNVAVRNPADAGTWAGVGGGG